MQIELIKTYKITATLELMTGLHIGSGKEAIQIGGMDSPVVKNPFTQEPYIPGSSIKGKLRSLLEWTLNCVEPDGSIWGSDGNKSYEPNDPILRTFGITHKEWQGGPTRIIVRDAFLNSEWAKSVRERNLTFTEEKWEVTIDRIQGKAASMGPRQIERIPAGARFDLEIVFKQFNVDGDNGQTDRDCLNRLIEGLKLLEKDALGGSGSRGYGRVRITNLHLEDRNIQEHFDKIDKIDPKKPADFIGGG